MPVGSSASASTARHTLHILGLWLCGGGLLAGSLVNQVDELVVKRYPVVFGAGRPLFDGRYQPRRFELIERDEVGRVWIETYRPR